MKHLKCIIAIFLLNSSSLTFGQDYISKSNIAIDRGVGMYELKKYPEAEKLLEKSIKIYPQFKGYYYLALTQLQMKDTCQGCNNFLIASYDANAKIIAQYDTLCFKHRRICYIEDTAAPYSYYTEFIADRCTLKTHQNMFMKNRETGEISTFKILGYDSVATSAEDFFIKHPDFKNIKSNKILFTKVKSMPEYPGGENSLAKLIYKNVKLPSSVNYKKKNNCTISVSVTVDTDGSFSDIKVLNTIEGLSCEDIVKALQLMTDWSPGKIGNTPVVVQITKPIRLSMVFDHIINDK
jgi:hypothetical protein